MAPVTNRVVSFLAALIALTNKLTVIRANPDITPHRGLSSEYTEDGSYYDVRYILTLGTEGTGHNVAGDILEESPIQYVLKEVGLFDEQRNICQIHTNLLTNGCSNSDGTSEDEQDDRIIYAKLVNKLRDFDSQLRQNIGAFHRRPERKTMNVHLNLIPECTVTYPKLEDKTCRDQEYLSLHIFYKACAEAGVDCGHMVMIRNPLDVWRFLAKNERDDPVRIIHTLAAKLDSIASQMASFGNHIVACWDYDDPRKELATRGGEMNLLGWYLPDLSFNKALERIHMNYDSVPASVKYPPDQNLYMEIMSISTGLIRNLCSHQLGKRAERLGVDPEKQTSSLRG